MKLTINGAEYAPLRRLTFRPTADFTGDTLPANALSAEIETADAIAPGARAVLRDDLGGLWARYTVSRAERIDRRLVYVEAVDAVRLLDKARLPAVLYDHAAAAEAFYDAFHTLSPDGVTLGLGDYALHPDLAARDVTGFAPAQSARERIQWLCFALGAYLRTWTTDIPQILPVPAEDTAAPLLPPERTYWRPAAVALDPVTAVTLHAYAFAPPDPETGLLPGDRYVRQQDGSPVVYTEQTFTLKNPAAAGLPPNEAVVSGVYLVNPDNAGEILSRLARWWFGGSEAEVTAIDNAEYLPGDRLTATMADGSMISGLIRSADFDFGVQARARLRLTGVSEVASAALTVLWLWDAMPLERKTYRLPVGYAYALPNPYIDRLLNGHRYVFRPLDPQAEGVVPPGGATVEQPCAPALDLYGDILTVISVDGLSGDAIIEVKS